MQIIWYVILALLQNGQNSIRVEFYKMGTYALLSLLSY